MQLFPTTCRLVQVFFDEEEMESEIEINSPQPSVKGFLCARIPSFDDFDVAKYRRSLGMSQVDFAQEYGISLATLKKWEKCSAQPIFGASFKRMLDGWLNQQFETAKNYTVR